MFPEAGLEIGVSGSKRMTDRCPHLDFGFGRDYRSRDAIAGKQIKTRQNSKCRPFDRADDLDKADVE